MIDENQQFDRKSLSFLKGRNTEWDELAKDCVCFANSIGGKILIGIEDRETLPPANQKISDKTLPEKIVKQINQRTINTGVTASIITATNHAQYIEVIILRSAQTIASTTDGRYYMRVSDVCRPVPPDEMARLASDKNAFIWEEQTTKRVPNYRTDPLKKQQFINDIKSSEKVSRFIKEKTEDEILEYYFFKKNDYLTNLGILWVGTRQDRASLLFAPSVQIIRYNEKDEKVWKLALDDFEDNPKDLISKIINDVPDWQESTEISDGIFRKNIPFIPIAVIRELVANALVHRTYSTRGDIFINIFPDRLEIHNPGRLPYGVTPQNILSQSIRRNEHLSKVFYELKLMEREGSGYDLIYELLLGNGKPLPIVQEGDDRVTVTIKKQFISKEIVKLMDKANQEYQLKQKEIIALGLIAQHNSLTAIDLSSILNQKDETGLRHWIGRLQDIALINSRGKTKGTEYFINPDYLKRLNFKGKTTLKTIESHRLQELIHQDLSIYPESQIGDIHTRIGMEIPKRRLKTELDRLVAIEKLIRDGDKRWTKYSINKMMLNNK
nr:ATP-binding protein [uncultured Pedobacter sp.]